MPTELNKPARLLAKLTKALHDRDAEIASIKRLNHERVDELEGLVKERNDDLGRVQAAMHEVEVGEIRLRQRVETLESRVVELDYLNTKATDALEAMEVERDRATALVARLDANFARVVEALGLPAGGADTDTVVSCVELHRDNSRRFSELAPQVALVEEQRVELTKILDEVREWMRRKDYEKERAILNRRALAGVAPERNRHG